MSRLLGLDIGDVRTGVAVSDELRLTARPLRTLATSALAQELPALIAEHDVQTVVVGRPRHLDGGLGEQAAKTEDLVSQLDLAAEVVYEDESGTTAEAHGGTDEEAARVILQGYLDEHS